MPNPYHDPDNGQFTTASGMGSKQAAADAVRRYRQQQRSHMVSARALKSVRDNGGVTIDLQGNQPASGYAYAPSKDTEQIIPKTKLRMSDIDDYIDSHYEQISQPGGHLGMWEDDGNVYLDVSYVGPASAETIARAQAAHQLAVFDLATFQDINVGKIANGRYHSLGEATNLHDKHRRKNQGSGESRSA